LRRRARSRSWRPAANSALRRDGAHVRENAALGMPTKMVYYYVCPSSTRSGAECTACHKLLRICCAAWQNSPGACLGFKRSGAQNPSWTHTSLECIQAMRLPSVPRGRVLFSPVVGARERYYVLRSLQTGSLTSSARALRTVMPWRYLPAIVQFWANDGRPYGPLGLPPSRPRPLTHVTSLDSFCEKSTAERAASIEAAAPARRLAAHEASPETNCAVCHDELRTGEVVRRLPCEHVFHDACILPWLLANPICPMDRVCLHELPVL